MARRRAATACIVRSHNDSVARVVLRSLTHWRECQFPETSLTATRNYDYERPSNTIENVLINDSSEADSSILCPENRGSSPLENLSNILEDYEVSKSEIISAN